MKQKLDMYEPEPAGFDLANYETFADMSIRDWEREIRYRYCLRRSTDVELLTDVTARLMKNPVTSQRAMFTDEKNSSGLKVQPYQRTTQTIEPVTVAQVFSMVESLKNDPEYPDFLIKFARPGKLQEKAQNVKYDSVIASRKSYPHRYAHVMINLDWSEKEIKRDFDKFLKTTRDNREITNRGGRIDFVQWHRQRIIPCCDLMEWARARDLQWSEDGLAGILGTNDEADLTAKAVGRTLLPRIDAVISIRMLTKLLLKVQYEQSAKRLRRLIRTKLSTR